MLCDTLTRISGSAPGKCLGAIVTEVKHTAILKHACFNLRG